MEEVIYKEEISWCQKAKVKWFKEGDNNTKFFHRMANGSRKKKFISKLELEDGLVIESEELIVNEI